MQATTTINPLAIDYRRTSAREERKVFHGVDGLAFSLKGRHRRRASLVDKLRRDADAIGARLPELALLSDEQLRERITLLRYDLTRHPDPDDAHVQEALALSSAVSARTLGFIPFPVQLMGALAILRGYLAEMATGEGKTLTVALAAAAAAWGGRPVHVVTANDYLASRDAEWLRGFFQFCGLTAGCVTGGMKAPERAQSYAASVTYSTPKEVLADFLRDRLVLGRLNHPGRRLLRSLAQKKIGETDTCVMRGLHWAILDEADNVLIDEAITPLIISSPVENEPLRQACLLGAQLAADLRPGTDYDIDRKYRDIQLRQTAEQRMASSTASLPRMWRSPQRQAELLKLSLVAREFYRKGIHYIVQEGKIALVDEFTGRIMSHRTWQQGLQQAIEAKEGLEISLPNETMASLSFQRFFRCFPRLAGVSGTASEASEELWQIYHLAVVPIPTNRPCQRLQGPSPVHSSVEDKWVAVLAEIDRVHVTGRPILIGTRSIEVSELLSKKLQERGLPHQLLNATQHREESAIIKRAGQAGQITIATNMAGRGTDIILGEGVAALGGLHVIATEMHESGRIDRQLFGRSARQGDPGSAIMLTSMGDDLVQRYLPKPILSALAHHAHPAPWLVHLAFRYAQRTAEKLAYRQRKSLLRSDRWLDETLSFAGKGGAV